MVAIYQRPQEDTAAKQMQALAGTIGQIGGIFAQQKKDAAVEGRAVAGAARAQEAHELAIAEKQDKISHDASTEGYLGQIQEAQADGRSFVPDFKSKDFDARAWNSAQILNAEGAMKNEQLMRSQMQTHKAQADEQHTQINRHMGDAAAAVSGETPDYGTAFKSVEAAYERHNDGADLIIAKDNKSYEVKLPNGETMKSEFSSPEAMYGDFQQKFAAFAGPEGKDNYAKAYMAEQNERLQANAEAITASKYFANDKGIQVQVAMLRGPKTGKPRNRYMAWDADGTSLGEISEAEFSKGNFKDVATRKGEAAIGEAKAKTAKAERISGEELKNLSPDEKAAIGIARTYDIPKEDAMNFVLSNKADKAKLEIVSKLITQYGKVDHPKVVSAIKGMGIESALSGISETPGAGLRRKSRTRIQKQEEARKESIKTGKGVSGLTKKNTSQAEQSSIKAIIAKIRKANPKWTDARVAQEARNEFTK